MLEVCVDTANAAIAAREAGANRIELCSALDIGGVTPCESLIRAVRRSVDCPLMMLIRPRAGDFCYDDDERRQIIDSIRTGLELGADGVVVGGLNAHFALDLTLLQAARQATTMGQLVLHRAFDFVTEPLLAIDQLVSLGFDRILTSGGPSGQVMQHLPQLKQLIDYAANRIEILPGGGVNQSNACHILQQSNCRQLHGSFSLTNAAPAGLGSHRTIDQAAVRAVSSLDFPSREPKEPILER